MSRFLLLLSCLPLLAADSVKIWDQAPHSAFTDLLHYKGQFFCAFREGRAHVSSDGSLRVIVSRDGRKWTSLAHVTKEGLDLRDPKLALTPTGDLMMVAAAAHRERDNQTPVDHDTLVWFSRDGEKWSEPSVIGDKNFWLWRATWFRGIAYIPGYSTPKEDRILRLYASKDGKQFDALVPRLITENSPNEATVRFRKDGTGIMLVRREEGSKSGLIGTAQPPYKDWQWKDLGARLGGPNFVEIPGGRLIGAVRLHDGTTRTSIVEFDATAGTMKELEKLPSSGDSSYAGLVWEKGELWISYYSSHEGKSAIYLARWKP